MENASLNSWEGVNAGSMMARKRQEVGGNPEQQKISGYVYDPYTGELGDPQTGLATKLEETPKGVDPELIEKHDRAAERLEKLEPPACDAGRMSARIKVHGSTISPFAAKGEGTEPTTRDNSYLPISAAAMNMLERAVTTGLTETADLSLNDMAACAFGVVDSHSEPIVSIPPGEMKNEEIVQATDITELPKTSTLLRKTHIIPDLLDSVEDNGLALEIVFGNVQVFNALIIDRDAMHEAPSVRVIKKHGSSSKCGNLFLFLLIELEPDGEDYLQWMILTSVLKIHHIPGSSGQEILKYRQMPSSSKDRHKHVCVLFDTKPLKEKIDVPDRPGFDAHDFVTRHGLGAAVAAVYFESETVC